MINHRELLKKYIKHARYQKGNLFEYLILKNNEFTREEIDELVKIEKELGDDND